METSRDDLIELQRSLDRMRERIEAAATRCSRRTLATPFLQSASSFVRKAQGLVAEAASAIDYLPVQSIAHRDAGRFRTECDCLCLHEAWEGNPEGHGLDCPLFGTTLPNRWRDNVDDLDAKAIR